MKKAVLGSFTPSGRSVRIAKVPLTGAIAAVLGLAALTGVTPAAAEVKNWIGTNDALWDTGLNWSPAAAEPTAADDVFFPTAVPATGGAITLTAGELANSLQFDSAYTLSGGDLTLTAANGGSITVGSTLTATINSTLIGAGSGITKLGEGTLVLGGINTFTGAIRISAGVLSVGSAGTAATGGNLGAVSTPIVMDGGTFRYTGTTRFPSDASVDNVHSWTVTATGGTFDTPAGQMEIRSAAGSLANAAGVTTAGTLVKTGVGTLRISSNNAGLNAPWTVSAGAIEASAGALGTGVVTVTGGNLAANGTTANDLVLAGGTISAANGDRIFSGAINVTAPSSIALKDWFGATGRNLSLSNTISGSGLLTVSGSGTGNTVTVSGANSGFSGGFAVSAGHNVAFGTAASPGTGTITIDSSTTQLAGIGAGFDGVPAFTNTRATTTGGVFGIDAASFNTALDLATLGGGGMLLGSQTGGTYTASTLSADNAVYRLGGGGGTLTIANGVLTGSNSVTVGDTRTNGGGTVLLAAANSYSGGTQLSAGTVSLGNSGALGSGTVTVAATSAIQAAADLRGDNKISNALAFGTKILTVSGTNNIEFGGPVTGTAGANNAQLTITNTGLTKFSGNTAGFGLQSVFPNAGTVEFTNGVTLNNGGGRAILAGGNTTVNGKVILAGASTVNSDGVDIGASPGFTLTLNAVLSNTSATNAIDFYNTNGFGTTILTGANTYNAQTIFARQIVEVSTINSVGSGTGYSHQTSSNLGAPTDVTKGTLAFNASNGGPAAAAGLAPSTLRYVGPGETTDRALALIATGAGANVGGTIEQSGTGLLKFLGDFTVAAGAKTLTLQGSTAGAGEISGAIVDSSAGATSLTKLGSGTWTLSGTNKTFTGATTLGGGTLALDFTNATSDVNMIGQASPLALNAGTLLLTGNANTSNSQTFASTAINLGGKTVTLAANATANPLVLNLGAISRTAGGVVNFNLPAGAQSATNGVTTSTFLGANGILGGYATVGGTDWATLSGTNIVPLPAASYSTVSSPISATATPNVNSALAGAATVSGAVTYNSLKITDTGASQSLALGTNPLTFSGAAGGLLYAGGTSNAYTISGSGAGIIGAGATNEFIVHTAANSALTISAPIIGAGAGSLTKAGAGKLTLTVASAFTGSINLTGGVLEASLTTSANSGPLGATAGTTYRTINFTNGATFRSTATAFNNNVPSASLTAFVFNFGAGGGVLDVPNGTAAAPGLVIDDGNGVGTASTNAQLQGSGDLIKIGAGALSLGNGTSNFSNFTGRIVINQGTLTVGGTNGGVSPLGATSAGTIVASGATFDLKGSANIAAEPLTLNGAGVSSLGALQNSSATAASFAGPITLATTASIGGNGTGGMTLSQPLSGPGGLTKTGTGKVTLTGISPYSGDTTVNSGTLEVSGSISGSTQLKVNTAGTLLLGSNANTNNIDRFNDTALVSLGGGTIQTAGFQEGTITTAGVGALALTANSTLDFSGTNGLLHFAASDASSWNSGATRFTLSIYNWSSGSDRLFFGTDSSALTTDQLSQILFYQGGAGSTLLGSGGFVSPTSGELTFVPVPEPNSVVAAFSTLALVGWRGRRRGQRTAAK